MHVLKRVRQVIGAVVGLGIAGVIVRRLARFGRRRRNGDR